MNIQSINNLSTKGLPAKKLQPNFVKKAMVKPIRPKVKNADNECLIVPIRKSLPESINKEEIVKISPNERKKVVACGSWSEWCGGGFDICGAYM